MGGVDDADVATKLAAVQADAAAGNAPAPEAPAEADLRAPVRVALDFADAADLAAKAGKAVTALETGNDAAWKLLRNQGVFVGRGEAHQCAFLYTGQGSQYVNMMAELRAAEPIVAAVFDEADRVMEPLLGKPLSAYIFVDGDDPDAVAEADAQLRQTEITQPAVLATDLALTELLAAYGFTPDMVMGHSLGEYAGAGFGRRHAIRRRPRSSQRSGQGNGRGVGRRQRADGRRVRSDRPRSRPRSTPSTATWSSPTSTPTTRP